MSTPTPAETLYPQLRELSAVQIVEKSKRVQIGYTPPSSPLPQIRDTMASAPALQAEEVAAARPKLPLPRLTMYRPSAEIMMIKVQDFGSKSLRELVNIAKESFQRECASYKQLNSEAIEAWFKSLDAAETTTTWSLFRRFVSYFGSAALLVGGAVAVMNAPATGGSTVYAYLMIASAVAITGNEAAMATGAYGKVASYISSDKETAARIATGMQIGSTAIAVVTGLLSGYAASNALQNANFAEMATKTALSAGSLAGGVGAIGEGVSKSRAKEAEMKHMQLNAGASEHKQDVHKYAQDLGQTVKGEQRAHSTATEMVASHIEQLEIMNAAAR